MAYQRNFVSNSFDTFDNKNQLQVCEDKCESIRQETLLSTQRSLRYLDDSEHVAYSAAEELYRQGEQLKRADANLDNIENNLQESQKLINGFKNFYSGLKKIFSNVDKTTIPEKFLVDEKSEPDLKSMKQHTINSQKQMTDYNQSKIQETSQLSYDEQMDNNFDLMSGSLTRLKDWAIDMNSEIKLQDQIIDTIALKVEKTDIKINAQNNQLNKLVKK